MSKVKIIYDKASDNVSIIRPNGTKVVFPTNTFKEMRKYSYIKGNLSSINPKKQWRISVPIHSYDSKKYNIDVYFEIVLTRKGEEDIKFNSKQIPSGLRR